MARLEAKHCVYKRLLEIRPALLCAYKGEQILTMASDEDILTIAELSEHLRVHPTTIYRLLREGRIPGFRVGSAWRFSRASIEKWEHGEIGATEGEAVPRRKAKGRKPRKK